VRRIGILQRRLALSPNTIKAVLNRAGLDESTSILSRAFELFSEGKSLLQVAITLKLEAVTAIQYHQQYFMLLGCTEFTKVYLQIKNNPWSYVNLVKLALSSGISDDEVIELLEIAKGHLPRVKLEYDRITNEVGIKKAELINTVQIYQQFVDRNIALKKREDELFNTINELEAKKIELQKSLSQSQSQNNDTDNTNLILKARLEEIISTSGVSIQRSNIHNDNNEMPNSSHIVEPSSRN
jgi:hypothetical protein